MEPKDKKDDKKPGLPPLPGSGPAKPAGAPVIPTLKDTLKPQVKIKGLQAGLSLVERLKAFKKKDLAFILAGLGVLFMAPLAEHFLMAPETSEGGAFKEGWGFRDGANSFGKGGSPYEGGINGLAPGGLAGGGSDVITPLNVRDPSQLVLGPGASQQPPATGAAGATAPAAPSAPSKSEGGDDWKDALKASASTAARAATKRAALPVPKPPLSTGGLRGLGAVSGGGGGSFSLPALSAANVPNRAADSNSLQNVKAVQGFRGAAGARGAGTGANLGALENLRRAAQAAGSDLNRGGSASGNLETAASRDLSGGAGSGGAGGFGEGAGDKGASGSQSKDAKSTGESLEFLRMKMEQEKALELKWKMIEQQAMMWPKLKEKMIETMMMKGLVEPLAGIPGGLFAGMGKSIGGNTAKWVCTGPTGGLSPESCPDATGGASAPAAINCVTSAGQYRDNTGNVAAGVTCQRTAGSSSAAAGTGGGSTGAGTTGPESGSAGAGRGYSLPGVAPGGPLNQSVGTMCQNMNAVSDLFNASCSPKTPEAGDKMDDAATQIGVAIPDDDQRNACQYLRQKLIPAARHLAEARDNLYGDANAISQCGGTAHTGDTGKKLYDDASRALSKSINKMNPEAAGGGGVVGSDTKASVDTRDKLNVPLDQIRSLIGQVLSDTDRYTENIAQITTERTNIGGIGAQVQPTLNIAQQSLSQAGTELQPARQKLRDGQLKVDAAKSKVLAAEPLVAEAGTTAALAGGGSHSVGNTALREKLTNFAAQLRAEVALLKDDRIPKEGLVAGNDSRYGLYDQVETEAKAALADGGEVGKCKIKTDATINGTGDSVSEVAGSPPDRPLRNAKQKIDDKFTQLTQQITAGAATFNARPPLASELTTAWEQYTATDKALMLTACTVAAQPTDREAEAEAIDSCAADNALVRGAVTPAPAETFEARVTAKMTEVNGRAATVREKYNAWKAIWDERRGDIAFLKKFVTDGGLPAPCEAGVNSCAGTSDTPGEWRMIHTDIQNGIQKAASEKVTTLRKRVQQGDALSPVAREAGGGGGGGT